MTRPEAWQAAAFAPGHVTGFFAIRDAGDDPARIGSIGAGFSVELGTEARVTARRGGYPGVELFLNGEAVEAQTSRAAVQYALGREPWDVRIEQESPLPVGQGFGASASGALSAALAVAEALGRPGEEAVWAAHVAEVTQRTGLGDVVGSRIGGFEMRQAPGVAPHGRQVRFADDAVGRAVVLVVLDAAVPTRDVLSDPTRRARIDEAGAKASARLARSPDVETFCAESRAFARAAGLTTPAVERAVDRLAKVAPAAQCMLGGSAFVFAELADVKAALPEDAVTFATRVAARGARVTVPRHAAPE